MRESPAVDVAGRLRDLGAEVRAVEPYAEPRQLPAGITIVDLTEREVRAADAVVVVTDHDGFDYDLVGGTPATSSTPATAARGPTWSGSDLRTRATSSSTWELSLEPRGHPA